MVPIDPTRRWVCIGYELGNTMESGCHVTFTLSGDTTLIWKWIKQYYVAVTYYTPDGYHPNQTGSGWYSRLDTVFITTDPSYSATIDYSFNHWNANPTTYLIDTPGDPTTFAFIDTAGTIHGCLHLLQRRLHFG